MGERNSGVELTLAFPASKKSPSGPSRTDSQTQNQKTSSVQPALYNNNLVPPDYVQLTRK